MIHEFGRIMAILWAQTKGFLGGLGSGQIVAGVVGAIVLLLTCFMLFTAGWTHPPIAGKQTGYRGSGQKLIYNPRKVNQDYKNTKFSDDPPPAGSGGPKARDVWQNVHVLRNLSVGQFIRQMQGMTKAVAPEQGCSYCHANGNFASDALYTKTVARRMLQMTREINTKWSAHVGNVGVTCYTCHRGNHVPKNVWTSASHRLTKEGARSGASPSAQNNFMSLPTGVFYAYLDNDRPINVQGDYALPQGNRHSIKQTEGVFGLMMHMSNSLGVNCSFCHNSRSFASWKGQGRSNKIRSWYGVHMLREVNRTYMGSLASVFPANRKGPDGQPSKANCATCHQGVYKPLYGQKVISIYPELAVPKNRGGNGQSIPASAPKPDATPTRAEAQTQAKANPHKSPARDKLGAS